MLQVDLDATVRKNFGKGASRTMRREGQTPAILYGPKSEPLALTLDTNKFTKALLKLQRRNAVINIDIKSEGRAEKRHVLIKEIQVDPIQDTLKHADFYEIVLDSPAVFTVPVKYVGKAAGVDLGGDLEIYVKKVTLKGNPLDIPDVIEVDISPLKLDEKITNKDLVIPESVSLLDKPNTICVEVIAPRVAAVVAAPVVDKKKKK